MAPSTPTTQSVCNGDGRWCTFVYDTTHNQTLAHAADWLIAKPIAIIGLIVGALVIRWLIHRFIDRITRRAAFGTVPSVLAHNKVTQILVEANPAAAERRQQRAETMGGLLKSVTTAVVAVIVIFMAIAELGYDIAPLLASAGIVGVALGFGAQNVVKDYLNGIFMILEDQYGVGDSVNVGAASGTIEAVGLRVTRLRDVNGTVWYVRNGEILAVGNMSQNWARVVQDIPVSYTEDLSRVRAALQDAADGLANDPEYATDIVDAPEVWGVERWDPDAIVVRVVVKTLPNRQATVGRALRERIRERFEAEGIEMHMPRRMVVDGPPSP